jgi:16S rRNA (guanine527-N7)-methyltransferase
MASSDPDLLPIGEVAIAMAPYAVPLSDEQLTAIAKYVQLLLRWNKATNLTAIEDPKEIVCSHFGESIFAISAVPDLDGRLADVGTGAGFPGMPLKIALPHLLLTLIEPNNKKCAFLNEVRGELHLSGVDVLRSRYEDVPGDLKPFHFVCSRAMGDHRRFLKWAGRALQPKGVVILWLGTEDSLIVSKTAGWMWGVPIPIPNSIRRVIQIGTPQA